MYAQLEASVNDRDPSAASDGRNIAKPRVLHGTIQGAHGIRGEIVVRSFTAEPKAIGDYGDLQGADGKVLPRLTVVRVTQRGVIARLAGVADRTAAESYKGRELWVWRSQLPAPGEDEFYLADLVGLDAFDPDGQPIGRVTGVPNFGAGDLIEVKLAGGRSELLPFTRAFVPDVDLQSRRVTIVLPELVARDDLVEPEPTPDDEKS